MRHEALHALATPAHPLRTHSDHGGFQLRVRGKVNLAVHLLPQLCVLRSIPCLLHPLPKASRVLVCLLRDACPAPHELSGPREQLPTQEGTCSSETSKLVKEGVWFSAPFPHPSSGHVRSFPPRSPQAAPAPAPGMPGAENAMQRCWLWLQSITRALAATWEGVLSLEPSESPTASGGALLGAFNSSTPAQLRDAAGREWGWVLDVSTIQPLQVLHQELNPQ